MESKGISETDVDRLRRAIELARLARERGDHPFGALLVDADGNVLAEGENTVHSERDVTGHAEINVVRQAGRQFDRERLAGSTLYASTEPCAMCAAATFWGGIGRLVFALSSQRLYAMLGRTPDQLPLGSREVLGRGHRRVEVEGPTMEDEAARVFEGFDNW